LFQAVRPIYRTVKHNKSYTHAHTHTMVLAFAIDGFIEVVVAARLLAGYSGYHSSSSNLSYCSYAYLFVYSHEKFYNKMYIALAGVTCS